MAMKLQYGVAHHHGDFSFIAMVVMFEVAQQSRSYHDGRLATAARVSRLISRRREMCCIRTRQGDDQWKLIAAGAHSDSAQ